MHRRVLARDQWSELEEDLSIHPDGVTDFGVWDIGDARQGKRTAIDTYRLTNRGGKGVINMKTTNKTGNVIGVLLVREDSDVMIVSQNGKIIRIESSTIRQSGRSAQGVRLVSLEEGDQVAAASVLPEAEETNGESGDLPLQ